MSLVSWNVPNTKFHFSVQHLSTNIFHVDLDIEDFDESFNYSVSRPDGEWVEYTDGEDEDQAQGINFYNLGGRRIRRRGT